MLRKVASDAETCPSRETLAGQAVASQILPKFGELVAEDYRRWANDLPRSRLYACVCVCI